MLFPDRVTELHAYVDAAHNPELYRWWGQYCESTASVAEALDYYGRAGDVLSLVRIKCYQGAFDEARRAPAQASGGVAVQTGDQRFCVERLLAELPSQGRWEG